VYNSDKIVNPGRHPRNCSVCSHAQREEIEAEFVAWRSPAAIAQTHGIADRANIYRHAHAVGLFPKRQRNIRAALERIIEQAGEVDGTASAVVAAVQAYSKINAAGQWIDRSGQVSLNCLFDRMSTQEFEEYAQSGTLPKWFEAVARPQQRVTVRHERNPHRTRRKPFAGRYSCKQGLGIPPDRFGAIAGRCARPGGRPNDGTRR